MTNVYSLADLKSDIEKKYAPLEIELGRGKVQIRSILRLGKEERKAVVDAISVFTEDAKDVDSEEMFEAVKTVLRTCAADNKGDTLINAIGDDFALGMQIMNLWSEVTQPGEAENSPA